MRLTSIALALPFLVACAGNSSSANDAGSDAGVDGGPLRATLVIAGDPNEGEGIFDPSIAYALDAGSGLLAYSAVAPEQLHVHTRIASSNDQGKSWTFVAEVNQALAATVDTSDNTVCGQANCSGNIIHEVPSLVIDPTDSADRLYKLFTHSYFANTGGNNTVATHYDIGRITLFTAAAPGGPWTASPLIGWNSSSTFSTTGIVQNANTDASLGVLHHCLALTEPGAMVHGSTIELALGCVFIENGAPAIEIDLIRSTDHARSFQAVSTLVSITDAIALGSTAPQINGADLFQVDGQTYLFASPSGTVAFPGGGTGSGYRGCLDLLLSDLDAGTLLRTGGNLVLADKVLGGSEQFVGACTAAEGAPDFGTGGDVLGSSQPLFGIFSLEWQRGSKTPQALAPGASRR